jgi:uncharacterized membrane protein
MKFKNVLLLLAASVLLLWAASAVASAQEYTTVYSDWVDSGEIVPVGDCYFTFNVTDWGTVMMHIQSSGHTDVDNTYIVEGGTYFYPYDNLRVFAVSVNATTHRALINIARDSSGTPTPSAQSGTKVSCDVLGQNALAGDLLSFPVTIQNNYDDDRSFDLSSSAPNSGWKTWFTYSDKNVYRVSVGGQKSKIVNLFVQTPGNAPVGESRITAQVGGVPLDFYVYITSANQSVTVKADVSAKIAAIGDKIDYDISLKNLQAKENWYRLDVKGLPDSWHYRFLETAASAEDMAEVIVSPSSEKRIMLEIAPPYNVLPGDYAFTAVVSTSDGTVINNDLSLKLKNSTKMTVTSSMLAYEAKPGRTFDIDLYVSNSGQGSALTNVYVDTAAPAGWILQTSPNSTNSIPAGGSQRFTVSVTPPGNIVASDYEVSVKVRSDQAEDSNDFRITVTTDSYIPYLGAGIIALVGVVLFLVYRIYGRR